MDAVAYKGAGMRGGNALGLWKGDRRVNSSRTGLSQSPREKPVETGSLTRDTSLHSETWRDTASSEEERPIDSGGHTAWSYVRGCRTSGQAMTTSPHASSPEPKIEEEEQASPATRLRKRQIGRDGDENEHQLKRARLTRKNLALFNNSLSAPKPGFVEGFKMQEYDPFPVNEHVSGAVLYRDNPHSVTLPHLAGEWKGRGKDTEEARLQSAYDGAAVVYARNQALPHLGKSDPPGHARSQLSPQMAPLSTSLHTTLLRRRTARSDTTSILSGRRTS